MRGNFLFKWVSILGAVLLLANTVLPGLQVYADEPELSTAWELGCWEDANGDCNSDVGTYDVAIDGNKITFSNIDLNYPGEWAWRPTGDAGYYGVKIIAPAADTTHTSTITIGSSSHTMSDTNKDGVEEDGRYFIYYWPHVTADEVINALNDTDWIITKIVTGTINAIETTFTIEINVNSLKYTTTDGSTVALEVVDWNIRELEWEKQWQVTFDIDGYETQTVASWEKAIEPTTKPSKDCNNFDGWYNGDEKFDFETPITWDLALTSKWTYTCSKSSWWGGGGSSRTTEADDTKATTWDTAKVDENNTEDNEEKANDENKDEENAPMTDAQAVEKFGQEQIDAYKWALENGITTMKTVEAARLDEPLTRAELAKMMVVYIQKVLEKDPIVTGDVSYPDVDESLGDLYGYIKLAYQYQIMWINADGTPIEFFKPNGLVTRWEYATVFSRVLFWDKFNKAGEDFYSKHLEALKAAWILTNTIPTIQEMRGWVMLMMYRSSQNAEKIENVANTTETNEEEKADEETATASDETKSEANEEEKAEEATNTEATTGDVAETPATQESSETTAENTETTAEATTWDVAEAPTAEASTWDTASN